MKATIFFVLCYLGLSTLTFGADKFQGVERDKIMHFSVSMAGQVSCAAIADAVLSKTAANISCAAAVLTAGVLTEYGAAGPNTKDHKDILANTAGVGLGALIVQWKF